MTNPACNVTVVTGREQSEFAAGSVTFVAESRGLAFEMVADEVFAVPFDWWVQIAVTTEAGVPVLSTGWFTGAEARNLFGWYLAEPVADPVPIPLVVDDSEVLGAIAPLVSSATPPLVSGFAAGGR